MLPKILLQSFSLILIQWLMIKFVLINNGVDALGHYFFYLSILSPLFMLIGAHFKNYATQNIYGHWSLLLQIRIAQLLLLLVGTVLLGIYFNTSLFLLVAVLKLFEMSVDTKHALEIRQQRVGFVLGLVLLSLLIVLLAFWLEAQLLIIGWFGVAFIILMYSSIDPKIGLSASFSPTKVARPFFKIVSTIGIQAGIVAMIASIPRVSLEYLGSSVDLAIFGALIYFYLIAQMVAISLFQSGIKNGRRMKVVKPIMQLLVLGIAATVLSIFIAKPLVTLIFDQQMAIYSSWLPYFVGFITIGTLGVFLEQVFIQLGEAKHLLRINVFVLVMAVIFCPLLINFNGLLGAVVYMYFINTVKLVLLWVYLFKVKRSG